MSFKSVSIKSLLVVAWACLIAGAAVASESHRLCLEESQTEFQTVFERLHEDLQRNTAKSLLPEESVLIITQVDVTN